MSPSVPPASARRERLLQELGIARATALPGGAPQASLADAAWLRPFESDPRFRRVLEDLRAVMTEFDQDGRIVYVSPNSGDLSGFEPRDLIGSHVHAEIHDEDLPNLLEASKRISAGERALRARFRTRHRDGHWVWIELLSSTRFRAEDGSIHSASFSRDITEQKDAEDARLVSEERYRAIAAASPDMLIELDESRKATYLSERISSRLGLSSEALQQLKHLSLVHPDDRDVVARALSASFLQNRPVELTPFRVRHADGRWLHWEARGIPYQRGNGDRRLLMLARDVSERLAREEEQHNLERRMQQAQRLESLGVLAGGIAHDFNNLLTPILGDAHLALEDLPAESPLRTRLQRIERAARRASQLTAQMLAYAGAEPLAREAIDVSALVRELGGLLQGGVAGRAQLHFELARGLPRLQGDASQLTQVTMNLITNAIEAVSEQGGRVDLRSGLLELPAYARRGEWIGDTPAPGLYLYLEVEDDGCGMDAETRSRIFDPFFTTKFKGRGLGLAAVLGIVRAHAGCIEIDSAPGRGTRFRVLLPCGDKEPAA